MSTLAMAAPEAFLRKSNLENIPNNFTFLFQGDSITDGNRSRNNDWNHVMGHGYQYIIASKLWYEFPKKGFHFFNRGVTANKVTDLAARWQEDTINLQPNLLSILIGINDTLAFINGDKNFSADAYEKNYQTLLKRTRQQLPGVVLVLGEPFILPVGRLKDYWKEFSDEVDKKRAVVKKLSIEFNAIFVPFQEAFNKALSKAKPDYWIWDGVHPMPAGHELMAIEWLKQVSNKIKLAP
ncbi:MAG TPA: SGNH/GDSL hydrolase family protein [Puia sp.]|nr:SGNH/GDSL hydrolase family protein [Puia sp.]